VTATSVPAADGRRLGALREVALALLAAAAYFGVRNLTEGDETDAVRHATDLFALERRLYLDLEAAAQELVASRQWLVDAVNWIYIWGHWPVIIPVMVGLYLASRHHYRRLRNAFFISGAIGLVIFATYPVAPPRLADLGLLDTVTLHSHSYRVLQPPGFTNRYAALPSLHAGWNLILSVVVWQAVSRWWVRGLLVALATAMGFSVVATANHFVLDVVLGVALALLGLAVAGALERRSANGGGWRVGRWASARRQAGPAGTGGVPRGSAVRSGGVSPGHRRRRPRSPVDVGATTAQRAL
jgi:membrane-associated phospholipid phosphatase